MTVPLRELRPALLVLSASRLVINSAHRMTSPFLPVIARGLGVSLEDAGTLVAVRSAASAATPFIITAGRKRQRRRVIQLGLVMFVAGALVTAVANAFAGALVGFASMGLAKSVFDVSGQAYLSDRTPYAKRARYLALFEVTWAGAFLMGAPAVGLIIHHWGWRGAYYVLGTLGAVAVIVLPRVVRPDDSGEGERGRLTLDRSALALIVTAGLFSGAAESVSVVLGAWFEDSFAIAVGAIAGLSALLGLFELSGSSLTALITDRLGKKRAVQFGLTSGAVCYLGMGWAQDSLILGIGAAAVGFAAFEFTIVSTYPLASEVAPNARARYLAWLVVSLNAGRTLAAFFGTRLFVGAGFRANAFTAAAVNLVAVAILTRFVVERPGQPAASSID